jgi:hypothetical protein
VRRLAAPPAREITEREEDDDDDDDPQDSAEDAPPFDDTRSFRPFWAFAREIPKRGAAPAGPRLASDRKQVARTLSFCDSIFESVEPVGLLLHNLETLL